MSTVTVDAILSRLRELDPEAWPEVCDFIGYLVHQRGRGQARGSAKVVMASYGTWHMPAGERERIEDVIREQRELEDGRGGTHL